MIVFTVVRYRNFMTTGNSFLEIPLVDSPKTLITGKNGSGKSSGIIDAVFYALYGKPYRDDITLSGMINSINKKQLVVELEFDTNGKHYKIVRGMKPKVFEVFCDGELVEQDAAAGDYQSWIENSVVKMNAQTMRQIVFLGSTSFVPFMKLPTPKRRQVVEEILDIQIFSVMNAILKRNVKAQKEDYVQTLERFNSISLELVLKENHADELRRQTTELTTMNDDEIVVLETAKKSAKKERLEIKNTMSSIAFDEEDRKRIDIAYRDLRDNVTRLVASQETIATELKFFENNQDCPTCAQEIDEEFKHTKIDELSKSLSDTTQNKDKFSNLVRDFDEKMKSMDEKSVKLTSATRELSARDMRIASIDGQITSLKEKNKKIVETKSNESVELLLEEIQDLRSAVTIVASEKDALLEEARYFTMIAAMLKDGGIKSQIIKNYIPTINSLIARYLEILEFPCGFTFDENFDETIRSRFRDTFRYGNFSAGQQMRIDLALMFAWRDLARIRNSAACNLLVLDEIGSSSLDAEGTEAFLRIISETAKDSNVFMISHDTSIMDRFSSVIEYEIVDNFTIMTTST